MLCVASACGCAFESSTLNITIGPDGEVIFEQAEFTDLAALSTDVATLQGQMTTALADIATLISSVATNGAAITRLDAMRAGVVQQSGSGVGPSSGAAHLVVATASPGPFGYAGVLHWGGHAVYTKTVGTDTFDVHARDDGNNRARGADRTQLTAGWASAATAMAVTATDDPTIDITIVRNAGTGTATTGATTRDGALWWVFIPN